MDLCDGSAIVPISSEIARAPSRTRNGWADSGGFAARSQAPRISSAQRRYARRRVPRSEYGAQPGRMAGCWRSTVNSRPAGRFEPADDQQVFESSRDKQLAIDEGAQVTRAQIRPASIVGEHSVKGLQSFLLAPPVAFCNARR